MAELVVIVAIVLVLVVAFCIPSRPTEVNGRKVGDKWQGVSSEVCQRGWCGNQIKVAVEYECIDIGKWGGEWMPEVKSKDRATYPHKIGSCYFCSKECMAIYDADYDGDYVGAPKIRNRRDFTFQPIRKYNG